MRPAVVIVAGPSASGKSTLGHRMARALSCAFVEGDEYHSEANREKMRSGAGLTDSDRWPWLLALACHAEQLASAAAECGGGYAAVVACSALKRSYRDVFREHICHGTVHFIMLVGSADLLAERCEQRSLHFISDSAFVRGQLEALELPARHSEPDCSLIWLGKEDTRDTVFQRAMLSVV